MQQETPVAPTLTLTFASDQTGAGTVFSFGTTGSVSQGPIANFPVNGFTATCWFQTSDGSASAVLMSYGTDDAHRLWLENPANLTVRYGAVGSTGGTGVAINDGVPHYVALTIFPSNGTHYGVALYVDGMPVYMGIGALAFPAGGGLQANGTLVLGRTTVDGGAQSLQGTASQFRLWNSIRTSRQIVDDMQVRTPLDGSTPMISWALTSAATSGTVNPPGTFVNSATPYYRSESLLASWTSAGPGATYELQVQASDGSWQRGYTGLTTTSQPITGYSINALYTAKVRATVGGETGPWSSDVMARTLNLGAIDATLASSGQQNLQAQWPSVDQAQGYSISLFKNGGATPDSSTTQSGTTYDLMPLVQGSDWWNYSIRGSAQGALGPANPQVVLDVPTLSFGYYNDGSGTPALRATWEAQADAQFFYLVITKTSAPGSTVAVMLSRTTTSYEITTGLTAGDTYTAQLRGIGIGTIGQWSPLQTVVIHNLVAPSITTWRSDGTAHTITFGWQFDADGLSPAYTTQLYPYGGALLASDPNSPNPKTVQNSAIVDGSNFQVRVQARADNSYGRWSQMQTIAVGVPPQVTGVQASVDTRGNITATWSTSDQAAGTTYTIKLTGPDVDITRQGLSGPPYTFNYADTHVQTGKTYTVSIQAVNNGRTGLPGTADVTVGTITPVDPNNQNNSGRVMDPVSVASGMYSYQNMDIEVPGLFPLQLVTSYSTTTPTSADSPFYNTKPLGERWNHTYNARIARNGSNTELYVLWGNGQSDVFLIPSSITGSYQQKGVPTGTSLTVASDLTITVITKSQMRYVFRFDGRLLKIYSSTGNSQTLTYNGSGQLTRVRDDQSERYIDLAYDGSGYLQSATDNMNRQVRYTVNGGNLTAVTDVNGNPRTFTYTGASLIETITDQNNQPMLRNSYQDGRVTFQKNARALVQGESWGTTFTYAETTVDGITMVETTVTDPEGNVTVYTSVKANGNTVGEKALLPEGQMRLTTSAYDGFNNLTEQTVYEGPVAAYQTGAGNRTTFTYDASNNLRTRTNPLGQTEQFIFDGQNNLRSYTDILGNTRTWEYSGSGFEGNLLRGSTDMLGRSSTITYKPGPIAGLYETITDFMGNMSRCAWNGTDLHQVVNPLGGITEMRSDSIGRVIQIDTKQPDATLLQTMLLTYKAAGQVKTSSVLVPGQQASKAYVTTYDYDGNGNMIAKTDPLGQTFIYTYDPNNLLINLLYPQFQGSARTTTYSYNRLDAIQRITLASGIAQRFMFDQFGRITSYTDPNGNIYTNLRQMVLSGAGPYPLRTTLTYPELASAPEEFFTEITNLNAAGEITGITDREGNTTSYGYSTQSAGGGRTNLVVTKTLPPATPEAEPLRAVSVYDPLGRLISLTGTDGKTTTVQYSLMADPTSGTNQEVATITDPLGNRTIYTRDALGRTVKTWWGKDDIYCQRSYTYDALNRLLSCTEGNAAGSATSAYSYGYDAPGNQVTASIGRPGDPSAATILQYDGLGQLVSQTDAVGNTTILSYTPWGAIAGFTNGDGKALAYGYDAAGRFFETTLPGDAGTITHVLDANGNRLQTKRNAALSIARTFDAWNRLLSRTYDGATVGYTYTPIDLTRTLAYSDQKQVAYTYNAMAQLTSVTDWNGRTTRYGYTPAGMLGTIANANGTASTFSFDDAHRLTGLSHMHGETIIARTDYTLDALGNRIASSEILPLPFTVPPTNDAAIFNKANEMTTFNSITVGSNANGNLDGIPVNGTMKTAVYDWFQQLTGFAEDTYEYDEDGLRTRTVLGGTARRYLHDVNSYQAPWQQMPAAATQIGGSLLATTATGASAQIPEIGSGATPVPLNDSVDRLLELRDDAGAILDRFIYGIGLIGQESADGDYRVFHFDSRGSTIARTDAAGTIIDRYAYGPYGALWNSQTGALGNRFLYDGRDGVIDDGNGLYFMRARSYAPGIDRFLQRDYLFGSLTSPKTLNRYAYVVGDPIANIDPLGLKGVRDALIALGAIGGIAALGAIIYFGAPAIGGAFVALGNSMVMAAGNLVAGGSSGLVSQGLHRGGIRFSQFGQWLQRLRGQGGQVIRGGYRPLPQELIEMGQIGGEGGIPNALELEGSFSDVSSEFNPLLESESSLNPVQGGADLELQDFTSTRTAEGSTATEHWAISRNATSGLRYRGHRPPTDLI